MSWAVWEYTDERGMGAISRWLKMAKIQKKARIRLSQKVDLLEKHGPTLPLDVLAGPINGGHIYKLKVRAVGVQLRPMLSKGPINNAEEYTFLAGATERGGILHPENAPHRAEQHRQIIIGDPERRRARGRHF